MRFYVSTNKKEVGANMAFNFQLIYNINWDATAESIKGGIDYWMDHLPNGYNPDWMTGSHDHSRVASNIGSHRVDIANTIMLMLPGTSVTYYVSFFFINKKLIN